VESYVNNQRRIYFILKHAVIGAFQNWDGDDVDKFSNNQRNKETSSSSAFFIHPTKSIEKKE